MEISTILHLTLLLTATKYTFSNSVFPDEEQTSDTEVWSIIKARQGGEHGEGDCLMEGENLLNASQWSARPHKVITLKVYLVWECPTRQLLWWIAT